MIQGPFLIQVQHGELHLAYEPGHTRAGVVNQGRLIIYSSWFNADFGQGLIGVYTALQGLGICLE